MPPLRHTSGFSGSRQVHSGPGDVIKGQYGARNGRVWKQGAL